MNRKSVFFGIVECRRGQRVWVLALFLLAAGCEKPSAPAPPTAASPVVVQVVAPTFESISRTISQPGSIQSFERTPIYAKIPGYVETWPVDIGDHVRKGEVLATLWIPDEVEKLHLKQEQIGQKKKAWALAKAQVETAEALVKDAEAVRDQARALNEYWKGQSERFAKLVTANTLDKQTLADSESQHQAATAALAAAEFKAVSAKRIQQEKEVARDKAAIDIQVAEADMKQQAAIVAYATLLAPFDGVVTKRNINSFDFVQPPTAGKGEPLYVVERRDKMRVFVEIPEDDTAWVAKDSAARVRIPALQGREFAGKIARTAYALDRTTRTLLVEIDLPNPKDELRPGMYAYAFIDAGMPKVRTLPVSAIATEGDVNVGFRAFCYLVEDGRARRIQIAVGPRNDRLFEVREKRIAGSTGEAAQWQPFSGAEKIVAGDLLRLKDGLPVEVREQGK